MTAGFRRSSAGFRRRYEGQVPYHFMVTMEGQVLTSGTEVAAYLGMLKLQLRLVHECAACGEIRDEDVIAARLTTIQLFGAAAKSFCPLCYRELHEDERDEVYEKWAEIQKGAEEDDERQD